MIVEVQSVGEDSTAFALAEFADAALMAVETSLSTRPGAADCLQRLDRLRTSVLGAVVLPAPAGKPARPLPEVSSLSRPATPRQRPEPRRRAPGRPGLEGEGIQGSGSRVIGIPAGAPARLARIVCSLHRPEAARHAAVRLRLALAGVTPRGLAVLGLARRATPSRRGPGPRRWRPTPGRPAAMT